MTRSIEDVLRHDQRLALPGYPIWDPDEIRGRFLDNSTLWMSLIASAPSGCRGGC